MGGSCCSCGVAKGRRCGLLRGCVRCVRRTVQNLRDGIARPAFTFHRLDFGHRSGRRRSSRRHVPGSASGARRGRALVRTLRFPFCQRCSLRTVVQGLKLDRTGNRLMRRENIVEHEFQRCCVSALTVHLRRRRVIARHGGARYNRPLHRQRPAAPRPHRPGRSVLARHGRHENLGQLEAGQRRLTDIGIQRLKRGALSVFGEQIQRGRAVGRPAQQRETLRRACGAGELGIGVGFSRTGSRRRPGSGSRSTIGTTRTSSISNWESGIYGGIWHKSMIDSAARRDPGRLKIRPMKRPGLTPRNRKSGCMGFRGRIVARLRARATDARGLKPSLKPSPLP